METRPTRLTLTRQGDLRIEWSDGRCLRCPAAELRRCCPCADCASERSRREQQDGGLAAGAPQPPAPQQSQLSIREVQPVGNYAYQIAFSDGHSTGMYPLELLRALGRPDPSPAPE